MIITPPKYAAGYRTRLIDLQKSQRLFCDLENKSSNRRWGVFWEWEMKYLLAGLISFVILILSGSGFVLSAASDSSENSTSQSDLLGRRFVLETIETTEEDASKSLNRISGQYERAGYSSPEQSFKSEDHYAASPFGREKTEKKREKSDLSASSY